MAGVFMFLYASVVIGVTIYLLMLAGRLVAAHERIAGALERLARTSPRSEIKPPNS